MLEVYIKEIDRNTKFNKEVLFKDLIGSVSRVTETMNEEKMEKMDEEGDDVASIKEINGHHKANGEDETT